MLASRIDVNVQMCKAVGVGKSDVDKRDIPFSQGKRDDIFQTLKAVCGSRAVIAKCVVCKSAVVSGAGVRVT